MPPPPRWPIFDLRKSKRVFNTRVNEGALMSLGIRESRFCSFQLFPANKRQTHVGQRRDLLPRHSCQICELVCCPWCCTSNSHPPPLLETLNGKVLLIPLGARKTDN